MFRGSLFLGHSVYVVYKCCAGIGGNTAHRQRDAQ